MASQPAARAAAMICSASRYAAGPAPRSARASSDFLVWSDAASSSEKTATVRRPCSAAARAMRMAISPRLAIKRLLSFAGILSSLRSPWRIRGAPGVGASGTSAETSDRGRVRQPPTRLPSAVRVGRGRRYDRGMTRAAVPREWFRDLFDARYAAALAEEKPPRQTRIEVEFVARVLGLPRGARILDVACGYGRHAGPLSRRGYRVVGVDLSRAMLAEARRRHREGPRLRFVRQDARRLDFRGEFDAVVNLYTSFGYFTPAQNEAALGRMAKALCPGGKLLIDHRDPVHDARLPRRLWYRIGPKRFVLEDRQFDPLKRTNESTRLIVTSGDRTVIEQRFRLQEYTLAEWRRMLRRAGLTLVRAYSSYDGRPFRPDTTGRLIVLAER